MIAAIQQLLLGATKIALMCAAAFHVSARSFFLLFIMKTRKLKFHCKAAAQ